MTRDELKDVIEIVGMIAIVVSLVFLGMEIRQNTKVQEREMKLDRILAYTDVYLENPQIAEIFAKVKAVDGPEPLQAKFQERYDLTAAEAVVWSRLVSRPLWIFQAQFQTDGPSEQLDREIAGLMQYWEVKVAIELNEDGFLSPEFIEYVKSESN